MIKKFFILKYVYQFFCIIFKRLFHEFLLFRSIYFIN